ncbi:MAG TPA: hypothetical protein IGS53_02430 [Leptolyngbyaceae cyanobacterium M33_DOE_097]|uniref:Phycobilisome protein n=1 Tax=Oscillatoriales cyanobacterium SpSt-418 TaxID=2282169 RepID=A0A7C3KEF5_9CYAN|nr:hypothetical protein [Leptolyngbyaceae cyanobacterium M33_DOE_097]
MDSQLETLFDEAESRYLKSEELQVLNQYVSSLPARIDAYRTLRDRELEIMQWVADQLQVALPNERLENLERSIKNALLVLRYCAMGVLLNDEKFVQDKLQGWVTQAVQVFNTYAIDTALFRLLDQRLASVMSPQQVALLTPQLNQAKAILLQSAEITTPA